MRSAGAVSYKFAANLIHLTALHAPSHQADEEQSRSQGFSSFWSDLCVCLSAMPVHAQHLRAPTGSCAS